MRYVVTNIDLPSIFANLQECFTEALRYINMVSPRTSADKEIEEYKDLCFVPPLHTFTPTRVKERFPDSGEFEFEKLNSWLYKVRLGFPQDPLNGLTPAVIPVTAPARYRHTPNHCERVV